MYTCIGNVFDTSLKSESPPHTPCHSMHKTCPKIIGYLLLSKMSVVYVAEKVEIKECKLHMGPIN